MSNSVDIRREIAKNIIYYREQKGLSQKQLADLLETRSSTVSNWENGINAMNIDKLQQVCQVLGVSLNDIYGEYANTRTLIIENKDAELLDYFKSLNHDGQEKVLEYAYDLVQTKKYDKYNSVSQKEA